VILTIIMSRGKLLPQKTLYHEHIYRVIKHAWRPYTARHH